MWMRRVFILLVKCKYSLLPFFHAVSSTCPVRTACHTLAHGHLAIMLKSAYHYFSSRKCELGAQQGEGIGPMPPTW